MDKNERQRRQREFTIYLVLFILLVIVGAITTNGQPIEGRRHESPYGNPYYGGYQGSPYGNYSGYAQSGNPYYGGMTPSYAWNQLHGYGNGPPFYSNVQQMYGPQGYGPVNPLYGPQGGQPMWGYHGGAHVHPGYGYSPLGHEQHFYGPPAQQMMMPHMAHPSYPFWGNESRGMPPYYPQQQMMGQSAFMGPYNTTTPYVQGYGQPLYPQIHRQPYPQNPAWW